MEIKQVVTIKASSIWCSYNGIEIIDANRNEVSILLEDSQWADFAQRINDKVKSIHKRRQEKLEEEMEKFNATADC